MQIECSIPATPKVASPAPAASKTTANASKPGSFASILEQEQAAKPEPEQTTKAVAEEAAETEETDAAPESTDATAETDEAAIAVATLLAAQVAAATTAPVVAPALVVDGEETAPVAPAATSVTEVTLQTEEAAPETKTTGFLAPSQPATTTVTPTAQPATDAAPTEAPLEAVAAPVVTTASTEAPAQATTKAPQGAQPATPAIPATPAALNEATTNTHQAAQPAAAATAAAAQPAATTATAATAASAASAASAAKAAKAATAATPATPAVAGEPQPEAQPAETVQKPEQASSQPAKPAVEAETVEGEVEMIEAFAAPTAKPKDSKEVTAKTAKDGAASVKGAQPVEGATTANAVTATAQTADTTFRDALTAQAVQPEVKPASTAPTAGQTEVSTTEGRQTTTPTLAVGTEPTKLVDGAQATAQQPGSTPAPAQDPGAVALKSIRFMVLSGEKQLTVKLSPESLGGLVIAITTKDGSLDVQLSASQSGTRDILEKQLGNLRDSLSREGIVVNRVSITADLSGQQYQQANHRQAEADSNASRPWASSTGSPYRNTLPGTAGGPRTARHTGSLDLYA